MSIYIQIKANFKLGFLGLNMSSHISLPQKRGRSSSDDDWDPRQQSRAAYYDQNMQERLGYGVVVGPLIIELHKFRRFYEDIVLLPLSVIHFDEATKAYIREMLEKMLVFLNEYLPNKHPRIPGKPLETLQERSSHVWLHHALSPERLAELNRDVSPTESYDAIRQEIAVLGIRVFQQMFSVRGFFDAIVFTNVVERAHFGWRTPFDVLNQTMNPYYQIRPQYISPQGGNLLSALESLNLRLFLSTIRESLDVPGNHEDRRQDIDQLIRLIREDFLGVEFCHDYSQFMIKLFNAQRQPTLEDLKTLYLTILGPYFATYEPKTDGLFHQRDPQPVATYRQLSDDCFKYGRFLEFANFAVRFGELMNMNYAVFRGFLHRFSYATMNG